MSWRRSLVRIATFNVDEMMKRLAAIVERREEAEVRLAVLHAERDSETRRATLDADAGWYRLGYLEGWRARRDAIGLEIQVLNAEETGARDALALAYEELKKYEHIEEGALNAERLLEARKEAAALDEMGMRMAARR